MKEMSGNYCSACETISLTQGFEYNDSDENHEILLDIFGKLESAWYHQILIDEIKATSSRDIDVEAQDTTIH
ncbi:hypothetical protein TWF506_004419 [Arthrobotrys conoides]|uniref:Uncharacterized protein n=1 Tax=Arthrobotrys conoides TaxID=74498 RepID=A0AAN8NBP3_9PEZI